MFEDMSGSCRVVFFDEIRIVDTLTFRTVPDFGVVKASVRTANKVCARQVGAGRESGGSRATVELLP